MKALYSLLGISYSSVTKKQSRSHDTQSYFENEVLFLSNDDTKHLLKANCTFFSFELKEGPYNFKTLSGFRA